VSRDDHDDKGKQQELPLKVAVTQRTLDLLHELQAGPMHIAKIPAPWGPRDIGDLQRIGMARVKGWWADITDAGVDFHKVGRRLLFDEVEQPLPGLGTWGSTWRQLPLKDWQKRREFILRIQELRDER